MTPKLPFATTAVTFGYAGVGSDWPKAVAREPRRRQLV
jgi:hypothetical protein